MGPKALAAPRGAAKNPRTVGDSLIEEIEALIDRPGRDLGRIERTLTDGYARALNLEAERRRLERRLAEVAHGLDGSDRAMTAELTSLAHRIEGNSGELARLRRRLGTLRERAATVRK